MRRLDFIRQIGLGAAGIALAPELFAAEKKLFFDISLAEFSFASDLWSGKLTNMDFPAKAKNDFGISVVEYVSGFFNGKQSDTAYMKELKQRTDDLGVKNNLIMVDGENIADLDAAKRIHAIESHYPWVDAAKYLGCQSIRVNLGSIADMMAGSDPSKAAKAEDVSKAAIEGYGKLLEYGAQNQINIIVENHVGYSCNGQWLANVMKQVNHPQAGVLPDFGNFCIRRTAPETNDIAGYMKTKCLEQYDVYKGVMELMPYAKGVSAKTHKFDAAGNEAELDYGRLFKIIKQSGFKGYVGIEYEGGLMRSMGGDASYLLNEDGIKATQQLLKKVGMPIS
jgi:sugar phosphate isomerase/epimerase